MDAGEGKGCWEGKGECALKGEGWIVTSGRKGRRERGRVRGKERGDRKNVREREKKGDVG